MKLYSFPISGRILVPANNDDEAKAIAADNGERLQVLFEECMEKSKGDGALAGGITIGANPQQYRIDKRTAERMTAQLEMPIRREKASRSRKGKPDQVGLELVPGNGPQ